MSFLQVTWNHSRTYTVQKDWWLQAWLAGRSSKLMLGM